MSELMTRDMVDRWFDWEVAEQMLEFYQLPDDEFDSFNDWLSAEHSAKVVSMRFAHAKIGRVIKNSSPVGVDA